MRKMFRKAVVGVMSAAMIASPITASAQTGLSHAQAQMSIGVPEDNAEAQKAKQLIEGLTYDVVAGEVDGGILENLVLSFNGSDLLEMIIGVDQTGLLQIAVPQLDDNVYILNLGQVVQQMNVTAPQIDMSMMPGLPEVDPADYAAVFGQILGQVMSVVKEGAVIEDGTYEMPKLGETADGQIIKITLDENTGAAFVGAACEALKTAECGRICEGWGDWFLDLGTKVAAGELNSIITGADQMTAEELQEAGYQIGYAGNIIKYLPQQVDQLTQFEEVIRQLIAMYGAKIEVTAYGSDATGFNRATIAVVYADEQGGQAYEHFGMDIEFMQMGSVMAGALTLYVSGEELGSVVLNLSETTGMISAQIAGNQLGSFGWSVTDEEVDFVLNVMDMISAAFWGEQTENGLNMGFALEGLGSITNGELDSFSYVITAEEDYEGELVPIPAGNVVDLASMSGDDLQILGETWGNKLVEILSQNDEIVELLQ